ncbi:MAG: toll/interleukin-1 receptor domain-containing protein, partial [Clostridiales bacterium]|nr:toll/interleukin-1 receptor domain-containing protein [Clostridiales bacterium]
MLDVFISYSSQNAEAAREVCRCLEDSGTVCWMAPRDILPGSHWAASITQAIRTARVLV